MAKSLRGSISLMQKYIMGLKTTTGKSNAIRHDAYAGFYLRPFCPSPLQ